jgi:hypothetical protein
MAQEYRVFTMDGRSGTVRAESAQQAYDAVRASRPDAGESGVIIRDPSGRESYVSSGFSTSDPERINQIRSQGMAPGQASRQAIAEQEVAARPVATRAASAIQGVPFVGEYADELTGALFGPEAQAAQRFSAGAMQQARPIEALATQLGVGIGTTLPMAAATIPAQGMSVGRAAAQGAGLGVGLGGLEGLVSGYGAGETPEARMQTGLQRAGTGAALGGALGGAAPIAGAAIGGALGATAGQTPMNRIAEALGISPSAARVASSFRQFEQGGPPIPTPTIPRSLAETSPEMRGLLDLGVSVPGAGRSEAMGMIGQQATEAARNLTRTLDETLGEPSGVRLQQREMMQDTAAERRDLYADAYSQPIDYGTPEGDRLLNLLDRVDPDVLNRANVLMRREGVPPGQQLRFETDAQGNVVGVQELPNVQQIDYITRAIQSRARTMGAEPEDVSTLMRQVRDIRTTADQLVPQYASARSRAAEVIGEREALDFGYDVLSPMRREDVQMGLEGLTEGELANVRSGMRQYIDDIMARVSRPMSPGSEEANEAVRALRSLTSREGRDKIRLVLGDQADGFIERINEAVEPLAIRAVGGGSPTAPRQFGMRQLSEEAEMGILDRIGSGQTGLQAEAARFAAAGGPASTEMAQEIANELAPFVAQQRAPDSLAQLRAYLDQMALVRDLPTQMLRRGTNVGYVGGLGAIPAAGALGRETGMAPADVRRFTPR